MREVGSDSPGLHAPCTHVPSEPTAMGGEPPEEAGGKGICSNVGQTDVVESLVKAGCSSRLVNADLYSGGERGEGENNRACIATDAGPLKDPFRQGQRPCVRGGSVCGRCGVVWEDVAV